MAEVALLNKRGGEDFVRRTTKDGVFRDGGGLYLQVTNGGKGKSWLFRYTFEGKAVTISLGTYRKGVTLDDARNRANEANAWLWEDKDPKKEWEDEKHKRKIEAGRPYLVRHFLAQYIDTVVKNFPPKSRTDAENHCETIRTTIGDLPAKEVNPELAVRNTGLYDLWDGPQRSKAKTLRQHLFGVFQFAKVNCPLDENPMAADNMRIVLPRKRHYAKPHDSIPFEDVPAFLARLRETRKDGRYQTRALMLEMLIFSGVRSGEARKAQWKEINGDVWEVPPDHLKTGIKMRPIPLTRPMLGVLKQAQALRVNPLDDDALIFPPPKSPEGRGNPLPASELSKFVNDLKWEKPVKPHGFRSTLAGWAVEKGWEDILVERQHDHLPKEGTAAAHRYSDLVRAEAKDRSLKRRREMMDAYADVCDPPRTDDNVVQFRA